MASPELKSIQSLGSEAAPMWRPREMKFSLRGHDKAKSGRSPAVGGDSAVKGPFKLH
jgi:hypothetical protein